MIIKFFKWVGGCLGAVLYIGLCFVFPPLIILFLLYVIVSIFSDDDDDDVDSFFN